MDGDSAGGGDLAEKNKNNNKFFKRICLPS